MWRQLLFSHEGHSTRMLITAALAGLLFYLMLFSLRNQLDRIESRLPPAPAAEGK